MGDTEPTAATSIEGAFARLQELLNTDPQRFAAVGGDVAFYVRGGRPPWWQVTALGGQVLIKPGNPAFAVVTVGLIPEALVWLAEGTLDVQKAFKHKRLAVEGDGAALLRFVACFEAPSTFELFDDLP
jgi:hypothetical protein